MDTCGRRNKCSQWLVSRYQSAVRGVDDGRPLMSSWDDYVGHVPAQFDPKIAHRLVVVSRRQPTEPIHRHAFSPYSICARLAVYISLSSPVDAVRPSDVVPTVVYLYIIADLRPDKSIQDR